MPKPKLAGSKGWSSYSVETSSNPTTWDQHWGITEQKNKMTNKMAIRCSRLVKKLRLTKQANRVSII